MASLDERLMRRPAGPACVSADRAQRATLGKSRHIKIIAETQTGAHAAIASAAQERRAIRYLRGRCHRIRTRGCMMDDAPAEHHTRGSGANRHTTEIAAGMRADQLPGPQYASDPTADSIFF